jgi:hypothetical protein
MARFWIKNKNSFIFNTAYSLLLEIKKWILIFILLLWKWNGYCLQYLLSDVQMLDGIQTCWLCAQFWLNTNFNNSSLRKCLLVKLMQKVIFQEKRQILHGLLQFSANVCGFVWFRQDNVKIIEIRRGSNFKQRQHHIESRCLRTGCWIQY